jgi:hypothetical protein
MSSTAVPVTEIENQAAATAEDREAERLEAEGWPVLRGTHLQRDVRFVKKLLKAQLALLRRRR